MSTDSRQLTSAPLPDICRNKHGANLESEMANLRVHSRKEVDRARIIKFRDSRGDQGITLVDVCQILGLKPQTASARLSELKADGELERKEPNERRDHCAVFVRPLKGQLKLLA